MPVYEIEAPNGKILEIEGDTPPTEQELDEIFKNTNTEQPQQLSGGVSIDVTPSGLWKGSQNVAVSALMAPYNAIRKGETLKEAYNNNLNTIRNYRKENPTPIQDFVVDTAGYTGLSYIPGLAPVGVAKNAALGAKIGNFALNSAKLGAIPGIAEGLKNRGAKGILPGGLTGTATAAAVQGGLNAVPYVGRGAGWLSKKLALNSFPGLKEKTVQRLINPNSKALDLTEEQAENLLMNTTERVRKDYNDLLSKKGAAVGNLLEELPEDVAFKAQGLTNGYDSILNNYSLSKNTDLNPAINASKRELSKINELVYGEPEKRLAQYKADLEGMKYPKENLEVIKRRYKNNFYTKSADTISNDIIIANRRFNDEILNVLKENPDIINNPDRIAALEEKIANFRVPEDYMTDMYFKFYEALGKGDILNPAKATVNPKELYDINKNISNMIDWDKPGAELKNAALEQIYMSNANKISGLSPQLKRANKEYSDLMDFQKNEGIRRILRSGDAIDTASSALRNYNSTITSGNKNRNVQDLEKILVKNGYAPFLKDIDDVNAANELLKTVQNGLNLFGLLEKTKNLVERPILLGARKVNRANIPDKINKLSKKASEKVPEKVKKLAKELQELNIVGRSIKPALIRGSMPMLYGGVEYQE